jgi:hypothetical protein
MYGQHRVGQFQLEQVESGSFYHSLKNVQLQASLIDPSTGTANNLHCLYVEDLGNNKVTLVKDLGQGQLFAHALWLGPTQVTIPSASFIAHHSLKECN